MALCLTVVWYAGVFVCCFVGLWCPRRHIHLSIRRKRQLCIRDRCSVYVLRSDGRLELFATEGLNREAVHLTTMRAGEGLVGLIAESAEPLALADAQSHPAFSYKPETGEEIYHSFLGVPILRGGNTLGVLVVQNRARRTYSEEEIEVLQTTSMLIPAMTASGELQPICPLYHSDPIEHE